MNPIIDKRRIDMKAQYRKIVPGILWALIFMVVAIMPASANAPVHVRDTWDFDYIDTDSCGFPLAVHIDLATNFMVWSDKDGNWLVDKLTGVSRASLTYEGRIVRLLENEITTVTYVDSHDGILEIKIQCPGMEWKGSVPGHGAVLGSAGNQVWTETCQQDDQGEWQCDLGRSCTGLAWTSATPLLCAITCSTGSEPGIETGHLLLFAPCQPARGDFCPPGCV